MIALGSMVLVRGFRLIGFEALENPSHQEVSALIKELQIHQQRAFLAVEQSLADDMRDLFSPIQQEGGDILMVELPSIHEPEKLDSYLAEGIMQKLGPHALKREAG
jgi:vacuolar-type H+-ATPase subunit F/Vma7